MSPLSILFFPVKKSSRLNQKRNMFLYARQKQLKTNMLMDFDVWFWCVRTIGTAFFTGGRVIIKRIIMDSYSGQKQCFKLKLSYKPTNMQHFTSQDINWWTGVLWIIVMFFISCLDTHSDGTHSLQRIHWWASDVMLNFFKPVLMRKQTHLHLRLRVSKFSFWVNYSINPVVPNPVPGDLQYLPTKFSSNPDQTQLNQLIKILRSTW